MKIRIKDKPFWRLYTEVKIENPHTGEVGSAKAVWDTGATNSGIRKDVVEGLGLKEESKTLLRSINATTQTGWYKCRLLIEEEHPITLDVLLVPDMEDAHFVIGMDVISKGDFSLKHNRSGGLTFEFTFRNSKKSSFLSLLKNILKTFGGNMKI